MNSMIVFGIHVPIWILVAAGTIAIQIIGILFLIVAGGDPLPPPKIEEKDQHTVDPHRGWGPFWEHHDGLD